MKIFNNHWFCAALSLELKTVGDYKTIDLPHISIVIYNTRHGFIAFENSCPHRKNKIFKSEKGNSASITCPLHGWSFKTDGAVKEIPFADYYDDGEYLKKLCLHKIQIKSVGIFIFVCLDDKFLFENQYHQSLIETLLSLSSQLDNEITQTVIPIDQNWLLPIHILNDPFHVPFVHPKTLNKLRKFKPFSLPDLKDYEKPNLQSLSFETISSDQPIEKNENWHKLVEQIQDYGSVYSDLYCFPNLHLSIDRGFSATIEISIPINPKKTNIYFSFITAKKNEKNRVFNAVNFESIKQGLAIYLEDISAMQGIQENLNKNDNWNISLGDYMHKSHFRKIYNYVNLK